MSAQEPVKAAPTTNGRVDAVAAAGRRSAVYGSQLGIPRLKPIGFKPLSGSDLATPGIAKEWPCPRWDALGGAVT